MGSCINNSDVQMWSILLHLDVFVAIHGNIFTTYFSFYSAFHKHMQCLGLLVLPAFDGYLIHWIFVRVQLKLFGGMFVVSGMRGAGGWG